MLQPQRPPAQRRGRAPLLVGAVVAVMCFWALSSSRESVDGAVGRPVTAGRKEAAGAKAEGRWPKLQTLEDLETLWEVPDGKPKGVLFVAHGCSHSGGDFWPQSPRCPHCLGLPEELIVREAALRRGYAVVAVSSFDRDTKCWHNTQADRSEDLKRLPTILRRVVEEEGLQGLPLYAFGASSGGGIALRLAQAMPEVQGVLCQINPVNPSVFSVPEGRKYPPTLFVHMAERDPEKAETVTKALAILGEAGTPAAELKVGPSPVTPAFLQRSPQISAGLAQAVVAKLREGGFIDEAGMLVKDPRSGGQLWRDALQPVVGGLSLEADKSAVAELLNVAYARHEIMGDPTDLSLAWLEAGGQRSVEELQQR